MPTIKGVYNSIVVILIHKRLSLSSFSRKHGHLTLSAIPTATIHSNASDYAVTPPANSIHIKFILDCDGEYTIVSG